MSVATADPQIICWSVVSKLSPIFLKRILPTRNVTKTSNVTASSLYPLLTAFLFEELFEGRPESIYSN